MAARRRNDTGTLRRVMVTRFSAIGDVAMTLPVVYAVCGANPGVEFVFVTRPSMATMMVNRPANLKVHPADVSNRYKGPRGMRRLLAEVEAAHGPFDALADLHNVLRTIYMGLMMRLRGMKVSRLNKARSRRRALTRPRNKILLPLTPQTARYAEVFTRLGLEVPPDGFRSIWGDGRRGDPALFSAITPAKAPGEQWIAVAPFAKHRGKIYPPAMMRKVVERLVDGLPRCRVFLLGGGGDEAGELRAWADGRRVVSLAGERHGFATELALMSHLDVMVSMDSANMHLASLVNVPVVAVWGATHPYCGFRGYGQSDTTAVQLSMTCRPCSIFGDRPCRRGDYHCLAGISPNTIADKVMEILNQPT